MPKVTLSESVAIAAGASEDNVLTGTKAENIPTDDNYRVTLLATASAAAALRHQLDADTDVAVQDSLVSGQNRVPITPDDFVSEFDVSGGSKLYLQVEDTSGTGATYFYTLILTPHSEL